MKNRKTVVVAFLLVAAMLLGVGYAALADELTVKGTLTLSDDNADASFEAEVYFVEDAECEPVTGDTITIGAEDVTNDANDQVNITVTSLDLVGETAVFTFYIKNDNDFVVTATPAPGAFTDDGATYFSVTGPVEVDVPAGESVKVTVTVALKAIPTDGTEKTTTYTLTYNVEPKA